MLAAMRLCKQDKHLSIRCRRKAPPQEALPLGAAAPERERFLPIDSARRLVQVSWREAPKWTRREARRTPSFQPLSSVQIVGSGGGPRSRGGSDGGRFRMSPAPPPRRPHGRRVRAHSRCAAASTPRA